MDNYASPTHHVADLLEPFSFVKSPECDGTVYRLGGFVQAIRDHGDVVFVDLRDQGHFLQVVAAPDLNSLCFEPLKHLKPESSLTITGTLRRRPEETENPLDALGYIELVAREIEVHNVSAPLPYPVHDDSAVHDAVKLRHRSLQMRKAGGLLDRLKFRSRFSHAFRNALVNSGYTEVETPILFKSTPEGARDFLVPSRLNTSRYYALVQSPQMLKQLLMMGGLDRYFQFSRCFRDEDLRADRQPEFTQIDLEASFCGTADFRKEIARALQSALSNSMPADKIRDDLLTLTQNDQATIAEMTFEKAVNRFGSDAPDLRFELPLYDGAACLQETRLEAFRRLLSKGASLRFLCLPAKRGELSRNFLDTLPGMAQEWGGLGLAWLRKQGDGTWQGPIAKFLSAEELESLEQVVLQDEEFPFTPQDLGPGTMLFFSCHQTAKVVTSTLGSLRTRIAHELQLPLKKWALTWVTDFPLFERDPDTKTLKSAHHPFTAPQPQWTAHLLSLQNLRNVAAEDILRITSTGYDLVLNGREIGGGSARIHTRKLQEHVFRLFGQSDEKIQEHFGFFLEALDLGAPPHCGMAFGLDRLIALLCEHESIRDVMAFPKSGSGQCLMSDAPGGAEGTQLRELGLVAI